TPTREASGTASWLDAPGAFDGDGSGPSLPGGRGWSRTSRQRPPRTAPRRARSQPSRTSSVRGARNLTESSVLGQSHLYPLRDGPLSVCAALLTRPVRRRHGPEGGT